MKIVIDAGHGYYTLGKRCPDGSMREWEFNSVVANYVAQMLAAYDGVETKFTHDTTGKTDVMLSARTKAANAWSADILVSIHANAAAGTWGIAEGIETFVYSTKSTASVKLANAVQAQLIARTGRRNRGVKTGDLHMVRETKMPAILVECGFMDNREEAALLKTDAYRRKCAEAIVAGIVEVYGLKEAADVRVDKANVVIDAKKAKDGVLIDGTVYVPLREVAEYYSADIAWDTKTKTATITTKGAR
ncbi:N-acetylmuramoyl-L-alanine amidase [Paenibacillus urinalis]|uniref:N-acetylmuramoyl-L-alanine amidase n=1 Tax=Paenibacillus urinalis TaxID=521520 RepID=A0ABY7XEE4_9BACL|nr:N-acetylmuramoyl-L-alanine amidase [Paenibacillus urinalis]WDI03973.1 N-acetylmuramoyl-L-alanine amidase [Paenibacillus urinalis]